MITIEESASMPGVFMISVQSQKLKRPIKRGDAGRDPSAAAAAAIQAAISYGAGGYQIFAPAKVLVHIPDDMRSRS